MGRTRQGRDRLRSKSLAVEHDVFSIDLPWGDTKGRTAIASRSSFGITVSAVADDAALVQHVADRAADNALVLLDVPLDGCEKLSVAKPQRRVDQRFAKIGITIASLPGFPGAVRTIDRATHIEMDRLCDEYDALLGVIAGIASVDGSSWSWLAEATRDAGAILTIADGSVRRRFAEAARKRRRK
jgi:hypothetical protein